MNGFYARHVKHPLDVVGSAGLLLATAPVHAVCAALVATTSGRPVYFHQERSGKDGVPFRVHKLRTMRNGTEQRSGNYPTEDMVTLVGSFLRRSSLDELPQLFNVLRGEMSFVGPRPALPSQVARYTAQQRERLLVRPGVTGLAQIKYRNAAPWSVRIESDREYVKNLSFLNDLRILVMTLPSVLFGHGQVVGQSAAEVDDLAPLPETAGVHI